MALPPAFDILFARLGRLTVPAAVFVVAAFTVYLPARALVLPLVKRASELLGIDPAVELPALKVLHASIAVIAVLVGASLSGLARFLAATAAITAGLTIALGFAARDVLSNVVSGVFIVLDPTFNIGDWIRWNDREGIIEDISFRTTRVHTFDNELVAVPNSELTTNAVENPGAKDHLRLTVAIDVDIESDLEAVSGILVAAARAEDAILDRPAPTAAVRELTETTAVFEARFWIARPDRADVVRVRSRYQQAAKTRLSAAGVNWPATDLAGTIGVRREADGDSSVE